MCGRSGRIEVVGLADRMNSFRFIPRIWRGATNPAARNETQEKHESQEKKEFTRWERRPSVGLGQLDPP
jgi:hypothetical protein